MSEIEIIFQKLLSRLGRDEVQRRLEMLINNAEAITNNRREKSIIANKQKKQAKSAVELVTSMDIAPGKKDILKKLASNFDEKIFLPRVGDIKNLFYKNGIDRSLVKSRQASINNLFFFLSTLSEEKLKFIYDDKSYCGPTNLEPISEAIKTRGNSRRENVVINDSSKQDESEEKK